MALSSLDRILPRVTKPARYTGHEWNSVVKEWDGAGLRIALAYPDTYEIGMSNLGIAILYEILNGTEGVLAERVFAPWVDMEAAMRDHSIPLFSLESRRPLIEFDWIGFSLQYELNYTNVLNMLDLAGIPILTEERDERHPLVIGGGSCAYNPEPLADFFDFFVLGEGEEVILELCEAYLEKSWGRRDFLARAARVEGVYVPSFYSVSYGDDGTVSSIRPRRPEARAQIMKRAVSPLPPPPTRPIVPFIQIIHDRAMIEIQRGCTQGCRFCQAGMIYRPLRERPLDEILEGIDALLKSTGYDEIALLSLSSSEYSHIEELLDGLLLRHRAPKVSISLPSLRVDSFSVSLAEKVQQGRRTGLTFAPEAGSDRLRRVINKRVSEEDLIEAAEAAYGGGWRQIKLYFMIGLPTETDEDVEDIVRWVRTVFDIGRRIQGRKARVNVNVGTFIPKPHTPFQWEPFVRKEDLERKQRILRSGLKRRGINVSWHDPETNLLESILARGDRRLGSVIRRAWAKGAIFDAWSECFDDSLWQQSFQEVGLDPDFYSYRKRPLEEKLPWDHISTGVSPNFLKEELARSLQGEVTPDCRRACLECGIQEIWEEA